MFDSLYDDHKGIIAFMRVFEGSFKVEDMEFVASAREIQAERSRLFFAGPHGRAGNKDGEIGYIATGLKEPALVKIGDTLIKFALQDVQSSDKAALALPGYREPGPVVFISFYPDGATKFDDLKRAFEKLRMNDAALSFEPDANDALGGGSR